ncbi:MAG: Fe-S cluster assembly protein SufD, partial [Pseudomonadota bacterium]
VEARNAAIAKFQELGLPHRRIEEWKYTDLRRVMQTAHPLADASKSGDVSEFPIAGHLLRIVDGQLDASGLPSIAGVSFTPLNDALRADGSRLAERLATSRPGTDNTVRDLNTALMQSGVVVTIDDGVELAEPIILQNVFTQESAASIYVRNVISVGANAKATIIESFEGPNGVDYQTNALTHLDVGKESLADYARLQKEGDAALHLGSLELDIDEAADVGIFALALGGSLSRLQGGMLFNGENANLRYAGVTLLKGKQHGDMTFFVDHAVPNCTSRELQKTVLDDTARGVFQGKILVRQPAQKTDGKMMAQSLLLSEGCESDAKPELEIYADDVVCGHGATSGQIDDELLYYLRARGIGEAEARAMLIQAFVGEALETITHDDLRQLVLNDARAWLGLGPEEEFGEL